MGSASPHRCLTLPTQVTRFRRSTEAAQQEGSALGAELELKRQLLQEAQQELAAIDSHSRRQLVVLRWQNAAALVGCHCQQSTVQSGGYTGELQQALVHQQVTPEARSLHCLVINITMLQSGRCWHTGRIPLPGP
jgi:hypothetical protein